MLAKPAPTDQRAGVRPISFVLDDAGDIRPPVTLSIRPEDLTRNEPMRAVVHQTMGREVSGWVDSFGSGLPTITISGHTGWRHSTGSGMDGAQSFDALNQLVARDFPEAQQQAIERGTDPGLVRLLFVDMLDGFAYPVIPTGQGFVLRRNKSRPLLFQYQISMQATGLEIDIPRITPPEYGSFQSGLTSLDTEVDFLSLSMLSLGRLVRDALSFSAMDLVAEARDLMRLFELATSAFLSAGQDIRAARTYDAGVTRPAAALAADLAAASTPVLRALTAIQLIPTVTRAELARVASHFNTVICLFSNALRDRQSYEDYAPIYGASGCSSTTGGKLVSRYANTNTMAALSFGDGASLASGEAMASIIALSSMDPILAPMSFAEIARHARAIVAGVQV